MQIIVSVFAKLETYERTEKDNMIYISKIICRIKLSQF